ncbi:cupin domain-containing protein [Massilia oculi]|uniref:cupin domain-containing protein n=1 Tax=Massilia oculi TaxID=945844 RepID=UPI00351D5606
MTPDTNPDHLISLLSLMPHPEGGHFKETYRSRHRVNREGDGACRSDSTAIYYLLPAWRDDEIAQHARTFSSCC